MSRSYTLYCDVISCDLLCITKSAMPLIAIKSINCQKICVTLSFTGRCKFYMVELANPENEKKQYFVVYGS